MGLAEGISWVVPRQHLLKRMCTDAVLLQTQYSCGLGPAFRAFTYASVTLPVTALEERLSKLQYDSVGCRQHATHLVGRSLFCGEHACSALVNADGLARLDPGHCSQQRAGVSGLRMSQYLIARA